VDVSNWLSDLDVTTPAHARYPIGDEAPPPDRQPRTATSPGTAALFLAAVWLVISAVPVAYLGAGRFDACWNDLVVGLALCATALIQLTRPQSRLVGITVALGCWLLAAPFLLQYGLNAALWNDLLVGVVVLGLAIFTTRD
jgi:hypothetical protein